MLKRQRNAQSGIALGPILFMIAILALLAAAIAAGSGAFNANTGTESAKAIAETIIQSCDAYQSALNVMLHNECDVTALDYTPSGNGWPAGTTWTHGDYTGGNGTGHTGNGQCAFFDPRGGGMIFKPLLPAALVSNPTGAYTSIGGGESSDIDLFAGYPLISGDRCLFGYGACQPSDTSYQENAALMLGYYYLTYPVCQQINVLLSTNYDPNSYTNSALHENYNMYNNGQNGGVLLSVGGYVGGEYIFAGSGKTPSQGCAKDGNSNNGSSAYVYACLLMAR